MKYTKQLENSYALGTTVVFECLLNKPSLAKKLYLSPSLKHDETLAKLLTLARLNNLPIIINNEKIFKELSDKENCMTILEIKKETTPIDYKDDIVLLVNPMNMGNLGTNIRTLVAMNFKNLAIIDPSCDLFDPKVIRSSMGSFFHLNIEKFKSFDEFKEKAVNHHFYPFVLQTDNSLLKTKFIHPFTLIFGNESTGLPSEYLKIGTPVKIPQNSKIDSLNLASAVTIGCFYSKNINVD